MLAEPGIQLVERPHNITQALRLDVELALAAGIAATEAAREDNPRGRHLGLRLRLGRSRIGIRPRPAIIHLVAQSAAASRAARIFGGDIGRSVSRRPVASAIALATAAIGGQIQTSPTPFAPYGCTGFGTSIRIDSIIGRSDIT